jgi:hypothetical protein
MRTSFIATYPASRVMSQKKTSGPRSSRLFDLKMARPRTNENLPSTQTAPDFSRDQERDWGVFARVGEIGMFCARVLGRAGFVESENDPSVVKSSA